MERQQPSGVQPTKAVTRHERKVHGKPEEVPDTSNLLNHPKERRT
ncbi:MAG: hypothetical protein NT070_14155 [Cyanobacteria bacterium]|nr:hypothetical protein [Cyanobacteriota bacterium]